METTIYNLLHKNRSLAIAYYKVLKKLKGFTCVIKRPITEGSIFGKEDIVEYDDTVREVKQLLLFGIFQEAEQGMEEFDTFIDAYALTLWNERLPQQTIIEVEFCNRIMTFKVDTHRNVTPSTCNQLFIKNMLVPAT